MANDDDMLKSALGRVHRGDKLTEAELAALRARAKQFLDNPDSAPTAWKAALTFIGKRKD